MKRLVLVLFLIFPFVVSAQEILGKKKKYIDSVKPNADLIIDTPEMSIWHNKSEGGSLYLICYFKDGKCYKTASIYPASKLNQWEKMLNTNCGRVEGQDKVWLDQERKTYFKILPGENATFALESTKSNE
jgi:hypothetical protein